MAEKGVSMSMRIRNKVQTSWNEEYNSASQLRKLHSCVEALEEIDELEGLALGNDGMAMRFFELARFVAAVCAVRWPRLERILDMRLRAFSNQLLVIEYKCLVFD
jgi:hypothetical protein